MYIYTTGEQLQIPTLEERIEASDRLGRMATGCRCLFIEQDGDAFWTLARSMSSAPVLDWECETMAEFPGPSIVAGARPEYAPWWGVSSRYRPPQSGAIRPEVRFGISRGRFISDVYGRTGHSTAYPVLHIELPANPEDHEERPCGWRPFSIDVAAMRKRPAEHGSTFRYDATSATFGKHVTRLAKLFKQMEQETFV